MINTGEFSRYEHDNSKIRFQTHLINSAKEFTPVVKIGEEIYLKKGSESEDFALDSDLVFFDNRGWDATTTFIPSSGIAIIHYFYMKATTIEWVWRSFMQMMIRLILSFLPEL